MPSAGGQRPSTSRNFCTVRSRRKGRFFLRQFALRIHVRVAAPSPPSARTDILARQKNVLLKLKRLCWFESGRRQLRDRLFEGKFTATRKRRLAARETAAHPRDAKQHKKQELHARPGGQPTRSRVLPGDSLMPWQWPSLTARRETRAEVPLIQIDTRVVCPPSSDISR